MLTTGDLAIGARLDTLRGLFVACRPLQWQKNTLVYAAFIFSAGAAWTWRDPDTWLPMLLTTTAAFMVFNAIASGQYLVNDAIDVEQDRTHPRKRFRPVASGRVSPALAAVTGGGLLAAGVLASIAISPEFALVAAGYAVLTLAYSAWLKRLVIVDVVVIALGFMLRALAGAVAIEVAISPWLIVCTTLGALFIAIAKRRQEFILLAEGAGEHRSVLGDYSLEILNEMSSVAASAAIVAFGLYVVSADNLPDNNTMLLTLPIVLYGIFRYRLIAGRYPERNADELIARDLPLLISVVLFALTSLVVMAVGR